MNWRKIIILGGAFLLSVAWGSAAQAKEGSPDIVVSPAITEWIAAPGQQLSKKIMVRNTTARPLPIRVIAKSFVPREKVDGANHDIFDASSWVVLKNPDYILKPGEYREVTIELHIPAKAEPGGHYATIYFQQLEAASAQRSRQTNVVGRVGSLVFITVKGAIKKEVVISSLQTKREDGSFALQASLNNTGNVHILPRVTYTIKNWRKQTVATITVPPGVLLPHTHRRYAAKWHPPVLGKFTVTATVTYGGKKSSPIASQALWNIPWRFIVPAIVLPLAVWYGGYRIRHRWQKAWKTLWKRG